MIAANLDTTVRDVSRTAFVAPLVTPVRPSDPAGPLLPVPLAWVIPTLGDEDPGREAYVLLGLVWRSPIACAVATGYGFDAVQVQQSSAVSALERLHALSTSHGAVSAEEDRWTFFVPPGSGRFPWPSSVTYISGPSVRLPPRAARDAAFSLRWITRGQPTGKLLTLPDELIPALTAHSPGHPP
ncbi:hypothetical protein [Streptomyces sp. NPDC005538]|uniref:hypothetical protein n=1 Tax=Streptomyces sp. NPDC005538 TaxID=3157043 RepID=UPI0033B24B29